MSLSLSAYLNERFQFTYDVSGYAGLYTALGTATWKFQVRPSVGSPIILLDFRTGGSPQSAAAVVIYNATNKLITVQGPTSLLIGVPAGTYVFDFGFTLPGADFERVDGGTVTFQTGTTLAGVPGSPSAPAGSDDTVTYGGGSIPTPVPATIISALSAANSSASAAAASATASATSATASAASATAALGSATSAAAAVVSATNAGTAAITALGLLFTVENLTVTATDTIANLANTYSGRFALLIANGVPYLPTPTTPAFTISGASVVWSFANSGVHLAPGNPVSIVYTRSS
jgi:hypothetical protein